MRDLDWSNVVADGELEECGKPCHGDHMSGTMVSDGMPCWRLPGHDGQCVCPMCPDAFEM